MPTTINRKKTPTTYNKISYKSIFMSFELAPKAFINRRTCLLTSGLMPWRDCKVKKKKHTKFVVFLCVFLFRLRVQVDFFLFFHFRLDSMSIRLCKMYIYCTTLIVYIFQCFSMCFCLFLSQYSIRFAILRTFFCFQLILEPSSISQEFTTNVMQLSPYILTFFFICELIIWI